MTSKAKRPDTPSPKPGKAVYQKPQILDYGQINQITLSMDFAGNPDGGWPSRT